VHLRNTKVLFQLDAFRYAGILQLLMIFAIFRQQD
jgi:hypothetical protein